MRHHAFMWCGSALAAASFSFAPQGPVRAQEATVTGQVVDARSGAPIQAVSVELGRRYALTGLDGRFVLTAVPAGAELRFRRLGYAEAVLPVGSVTDLIRLEPRPVLMEALYVEAERGELLATGTALAVARVGREALEASAGTGLAEHLDAAEGVSVSYVGAWGSRPVLRGLSGERVAVLVDGNRVNRACTFGMDQGLATVDPATVERVEILSGPGSALYGSGSVGGVINVVTRHPEARDGVEGEVRLSGSSAIPGGGVGASLAARLGDWRLGAGVDGADYGDYRTPGGTVDGSSYRQATADLKAEWNPSPAQLLSLKGQYYAGRDIGWPMQGGAEIPEETRKGISADWGWQRGAGSVDGVSARAFYQELDHHMVMSMIMTGANGMSMTSLTDATSWSQTSGGRAQLRLLPASSLQLDVGTEVTHLLAEGTRWTEQRMGMNEPKELVLHTWPGVRVLDVGGFAQGEMGLTAEVSLSAGVRLDRVHRTADDAEAHDESIATGNAGLEVAVGPSLSVRASLGAGYRTPDPLELYGLALRPDGFVYRGSADLHTERSLNAEVAVALDRGGLFASLTAFHNRLRDLVVPTLAGDSVAGRPVREYRNLGESRLRGVSARLEAPVGSGWAVHGTATYTNGEDAATGAALPMIPPLEGGIALRRVFGTTLRWIEVEWTGAARQERVSEQAGELMTSAWAITNVRSRIELAGTSMTFGVENAFDALYRAHLDPVSLQRPGRNFFVRLSRRF